MYSYGHYTTDLDLMDSPLEREDLLEVTFYVRQYYAPATHDCPEERTEEVVDFDFKAPVSSQDRAIITGWINDNPESFVDWERVEYAN